MKKIIAIITVLCLGLLILPTVNSDSGIITMGYDSYCLTSAVIDNRSDTRENPEALAHVSNLTTEQSHWLIPMHDFEVDTNEVTRFIITLRAQSVDNAGNISIYSLSEGKGDYFTPTLCNWTFTGKTYNWDNPGGDFNTTALDTKLVQLTTTDYTFEVISYLNLTTEKQNGFIIIAESDCNITFWVNSVLGFRMKLYHVAGSGISKPIIADQWNFKGFANATNKNASTIYSEITNCTAISYKNETSGYWYTYWPEYGILENHNLTFGDGLFILTDLNTTWDHT